jgi:hypothetical protein
LPDSANVFNHVIRRVEKEPMAIEIAPRETETDERFDMRALWRLGGWGAAAALALVVVAFVSTSDTGSQRLALTVAPAELPVRAVTTIKMPPLQNDAETKRLATQVRALAADRDRLTARIAALEHELNDLTGSVKRLADAPAPAANTPPPTPSAPKTAPPAMAQREAPKSAAAPSSVNSPSAMPAAGTLAPQPDKPQRPQQSEADAVEPIEPPAHNTAAPALDKVPLPPVRIAAVEPAQPEFGIALAGASSIEVARLQWAAVKANFGPVIAGLEARTLSERRGAATHYRLVAGPLPTYTAAARLCARIIAAHAICQPVKFTGAPL